MDTLVIDDCDVMFYRWRTCVGAAKGSLANAVGSMYVRQYFQEDAKQVSGRKRSKERARERRNLPDVLSGAKFNFAVRAGDGPRHSRRVRRHPGRD